MAATAEDVWRSFSETAARGRGRTALRGEFGEVKFEQLERMALEAVEVCVEVGISPGQLVAVAGTDAPAFVALVLAALRISAPALLLAPTQRDQVLRAVLGGIGVSWLITDDQALADRASAATGAYAARTTS